MNLNQRPIILIIGTRPECIKLVPLYLALRSARFPVKLCATFQHRELLQSVLDLFEIEPDFTFDVMRVGQDLSYLTQAVLQNCTVLFQTQNPQLVIVQGDTTSAMAAALAAFYLKIPVAHVEAGLRTGDMYAPFPEEYNRQTIGLIAKYHFAPTERAVQNLQKENIPAQKIYRVGNTVVDALNLVLMKVKTGQLKISLAVQALVQRITQSSQFLILLTMHRRENFGAEMAQTFTAIKEFVALHPNVCIIYPVHPNPQVRLAVELTNLSNHPRIYLIDPLPYHEMIYVLHAANCVVTDSGGLQEEAACLLKPTVLLRQASDRPESIEHGLAWLVGSDEDKIKAALALILQSSDTDLADQYLYGDGTSANQIVSILKKEFGNE